jgi:nitrate reductase gamma subunit
MRLCIVTKPFIHHGAITLLGLLLTLVAPAKAAASWLVDSERYHISAHGQFSCLECHGDLADRRPHPDPTRVACKPERPYRIDACMACHDHLAEDLAGGFHGTLTVERPETYQDCLACHDPHYQRSVGMGALQTLPNLSRAEQCTACHASREALPDPVFFDGSGGRCMACHQAPEPSLPSETERIQAFCFHCHGEEPNSAGKSLPPDRVFIHPEAFRATIHADVSCLACHPQAARYAHKNHKVVSCRSCHLPHDAKKAHDAHLSVACEACHLPDVRPTRDPASGRITGLREARRGEVSGVHNILAEKDLESCSSCHFAGNPVGAADMVLPPKSVLCMPCHASTFSAGDTVTMIALIVFGIGLLSVFGFVLSGSLPKNPAAGIAGKLVAVPGANLRALFPPRFLLLVKVLFMDVLLQRRLFRQSRRRWLVHSLIFFPFVIRFTWGLLALATSLWYPQWQTSWVLLDKNHPATALVFDLTGVMILIGVVWAFWRGHQASRRQPVDLARQDRTALLLIGLLVAAGFVLEGARIAMTERPPGAEWAFLGQLLAGLFAPGATLTALYGYLWTLHALLGGAFVAYLPFSRLLHLILAPITLVLQALADHKRRPEETGPLNEFNRAE